jgi:serine/threonine-protein kinase
MSPEAAAGEKLDARSDVFSTGILLWELLSGRRLYRGLGGAPPSLETARRAEIPDLPERGLDQEERLHQIVRRALSRSPDDRYGSAAEMMEELEDFAHDVDMVASPIEFGEWLSEHFEAEIVERRRHLEATLHAALEAKPATDPDAPGVASGAALAGPTSATPPSATPLSAASPSAAPARPAVAVWAAAAVVLLVLVLFLAFR